MNAPANLLKADEGQPATTLHLVDKASFEGWLKGRPERARIAATSQGFKGEGFQLAILPGDSAAEWSAAVGVANVEELSTWCLAKAAEALPEGRYRVAGRSPGPAILGWMLGQYSFDRYKKEPKPTGPRLMLTDEPARIDEAVALATATFLVRDLVNVPASDLGPAQLETAAAEVASAGSATLSSCSGAELEDAYPLVAAVGRAAPPDRAPRLIALEWGDRRHPRVAIVGKGVCFDSGGLDIKPSAAMRLMKKDMGGAAHALALAQLVMARRLPIRLQLIIAAVDNVIAGNAFRPGDVLRSRKGLSVEVGNTDAEGRLILADALTLAGEAEPELIIDFATLTGAARVALGPELPALFANRDDLAEALVKAGAEVGDPVWRLPLWKPYEEMFASDVADFANDPDSSMGGSIAAALFLQKFVPENIAWAHLDTYAWRAAAKPGRPKGGDALGLRSAWELLKQRYAS
jgi:leucyl aminopeptidase